MTACSLWMARTFASQWNIQSDFLTVTSSRRVGIDMRLDYVSKQVTFAGGADHTHLGIGMTIWYSMMPWQNIWRKASGVRLTKGTVGVRLDLWNVLVALRTQIQRCRQCRREWGTVKRLWMRGSKIGQSWQRHSGTTSLTTKQFLEQLWFWLSSPWNTIHCFQLNIMIKSK